jgi:class III poly(R)-hydroxyalkanoic acid synthase PhaE subunit
MNWTDQTNEIMKAWTDAQKQLWGGWTGWMQGMPQAGAGSMWPMMDPSQWMKMAVDTWSNAAGGSAQRVAGNIFGTPDMMVRSVNLLMKAWQVAAPKIEAGKPWQPDIQSLIEEWRREIGNLPARATGTANDFVDLTKSLFERWSPMTGPWLAMVGQAIAAGHPAAAFMGGTAGLNRLVGFEEGVFPALTGVSDLPRATVVREKMGKMLAVVDSLNDLQKAQAEFHTAMADAMGKAVERTMDHLSKLAEKGEKINTVRDLMRTWFGIADKTLNDAFTTPEFLTLQDKMTNALMTHKVKQREALEIVYDAMEIPTRGALDEAYRDIHDLKRQVRQLKRQVEQSTAGRTAAKKASAPRKSEA